MGSVNLKLDWATHEAAKIACTRWHYSRTTPTFKVARIGVWEDGVFIGVLVFGCGANRNAAKPYGLTSLQVCELVRVALRKHKSSVSRILSIAVKMIRAKYPGIRLIVSYADPQQSHHGGIYQACGWTYTGQTKPQSRVFIGAKAVHKKTAQMRIGSIRQMKKTSPEWKHKYVMPLDDEMRAKILPLAKPYPKRAGSADSGTTGIQPVGGGAVPTPALIQHV